MFGFLSCSFKFPDLFETQCYFSPNCEIAARPMLIECNYPDQSSNPHSFILQILTENFPGPSHCIRHWGALRIQRFCSVLKELPIYYRDIQCCGAPGFSPYPLLFNFTLPRWSHWLLSLNLWWHSDFSPAQILHQNPDSEIQLVT